MTDAVRRGVGVGFTGYQLNADASLNARARQYVPSAGRFTGVDPVAWGPGSNPYSYVGNAPTWLVDPTGMTPQDKLRGSFDFFWDNTVQLVVDWNDQQSAASDQRSVFSSMLNGWKSSIQDWIGGCGDSFDYKQTYGAWFTASLIFGAGEVLAVTKTGSWGVRAGAAVRAEKQIAKVDDIDAIPYWRLHMEKGNAFNKSREPHYSARGGYNEVRTAAGNRVDSYIPGEEIVERKFTQLSSVKVTTAKAYIRQLVTKYSGGTELASTPSVPAKLRGKELSGRMYLEVPVQNGPVPQAVLDYASAHRVRIRDVNGFVHH